MAAVLAVASCNRSSNHGPQTDVFQIIIAHAPIAITTGTIQILTVSELNLPPPSWLHHLLRYNLQDKSLVGYGLLLISRCKQQQKQLRNLLFGGGGGLAGGSIILTSA